MTQFRQQKNLLQNESSYALVNACKNGEYDKVQNLLQQKDINVNLRDTENTTALIYACQNGYKDIVSLLLQNVDIKVNLVDGDITTGLMYACEKGHTDIVSLLLKRTDINVNRSNLSGETALILACEKGHTDIVSLLLKDFDIDVNLQDKDGLTALMHACRNGNKEIVDQLLTESEIDVNLQDKDGLTALMYAGRNGNEEIVQQLLKKDDIFLQNIEHQQFNNKIKDLIQHRKQRNIQKSVPGYKSNELAEAEIDNNIKKVKQLQKKIANKFYNGDTIPSDILLKKEIEDYNEFARLMSFRIGDTIPILQEKISKIIQQNNNEQTFFQKADKVVRDHLQTKRSQMFGTSRSGLKNVLSDEMYDF